MLSFLFSLFNRSPSSLSFKMTSLRQNRFNLSQLFLTILLALSCCTTAILATAERSMNSDSSKIDQFSSQPMFGNRRTDCGVQTYKVLSLLCPNDFKYQLDQVENGKRIRLFLSLSSLFRPRWVWKTKIFSASQNIRCADCQSAQIRQDDHLTFVFLSVGSTRFHSLWICFIRLCVCFPSCHCEMQSNPDNQAQTNKNQIQRSIVWANLVWYNWWKRFFPLSF